MKRKEKIIVFLLGFNLNVERGILTIDANNSYLNRYRNNDKICNIRIHGFEFEWDRREFKQMTGKKKRFSRFSNFKNDTEIRNNMSFKKHYGNLYR